MVSLMKVVSGAQAMHDEVRNARHVGRRKNGENSFDPGVNDWISSGRMRARRVVGKPTTAIVGGKKGKDMQSGYGKKEKSRIRKKLCVRWKRVRGRDMGLGIQNERVERIIQG